MTETDRATEVFLAHRNLLFTVAYEMLGSAADAEDVLQETWLRWSRVNPELVQDERAYLVRIVTRLCLDQRRALSRRRETYVGEWLPEPLGTVADVADDVELAESVSMALMIVLETLSPTERAVYVLREVFGFDHDEIAGSIAKSPAAVRQIAHRARRHVEARRPRHPLSTAQAQAAVETMQHAIEIGDFDALFSVLAPDVVMIADGGGVKRAALRPVVGAEKVVRLLVGGVTKRRVTLSARVAQINGSPALLLFADGELDGALAVRLDGERVTGLYYVRNPEKLSRVLDRTPLAR